jgi:hypothetical protein
MADLVQRGNAFLSPDRPALEIRDVWVNSSGSNLLAKVTVTIPPWGLTLHDCSVVRVKDGGFFVFPPSMPMVGKDGAVIKGQSGKAQYRPAVLWEKNAGRRFSEAVIKSLKASHPELFGGAL